MQKKLIAMAVAGFASGAAFAQSNVTVYGILDMAYIRAKADGADTRTFINSGGMSGSRLGFKGVEDLGNGLKAVFNLEWGVEMDQQLGLVITVILLASSLTAYRAETAIAHGDRKTCERNLLGTILMGTIFLLAVVALEWPTALAEHVTPHAGFGISLFAMTGMHAFHVLSGVVILLLVWANLRKGAYSSEHHWGVEATVKYWHMVDLVWVFFYPVLYLLGPIK